MFQEMVFTSFLCGGIILIIWGVNKAIGHRYQRVWRYYLWLVIGIRLMIPLDFSVNEAPVSLETETIYHIVNREEGILINGGNDKTVAPKGGSLPPQASMAGADSQRTDVWETLFYVWLFGFGAVTIYIFISYLIQKIRLRSAHCSMPDMKVRQLWKQMKEEAGIRGNIPICKCTLVHAPMVTGLWNKRMVIPEKNFDEKELTYIFRHELQHLRHHDIWLKMMYLMLCAVYWFQPAVWLMKREMAKDLEVLCDRRVVGGFSSSERYLYTQTMIRCMTSGRNFYMPVSSGFGDDVKIMKERIMMIMKGNRLKEGFGIFSVILMLTISGMFLISCSDKDEEASDLVQADAQSENTGDAEEIDDPDAVDSENGTEIIESDNGTAAGENGNGAENNDMVNDITNDTENDRKSDLEKGSMIQGTGSGTSETGTGTPGTESGISAGETEDNSEKTEAPMDETSKAGWEIGHMDNYYYTITLPQEFKDYAICNYNSEADEVAVIYNGTPLADYEHAEYTFFFIKGFAVENEGDIRQWYDNFTVLWSDGSYSYAFGQPLDTALGNYTEEDMEIIRTLASLISSEYIKEHFIMKNSNDDI